MYRLHHQVEKMSELGTTLAVTSNRSTLCFSLVVIANVVPSSSIPITLMMEAIHSTETSFLTRITRRHTSEDGILHIHCCKNLKSDIALTGWTL
jgi:hypothetical protein